MKLPAVPDGGREAEHAEPGPPRPRPATAPPPRADHSAYPWVAQAGDAPPSRRRLPWLRRPKPAAAAAGRLRALSDVEPDRPATPDAAASPPLLAPVRPLLEGFALLAALAVFDLALGGRAFLHWPLHPFLLPVLYVAARHGLWPGLTVAVAAVVLRLGLALVADVWTERAWAEPLAWPLAAALVGGLAEVTRHRLDTARRAAEAAVAERAAMAESNDRLAARAVELEASLGSRLAATGAVFEAARAMRGGTEGVVRGACRLVRAATGCTACSFWLLESGALHLVAQEGWPDGAPLSHLFARGPLVEAMSSGGGVLIVTRPADRLALGEEGILAAPILAPWDGAPLGMVKVEDIGFAELSAETVAALQAAAGWLGTALAEARSAEATAEGGVTPSFVAGGDASRAIAAMGALAQRVGFDLALLSAEIPRGPRAAAAMEATRAAMTEAFRGSDLLIETRGEERRISVLLPGASATGAEAAAARLRALLTERAPAVATGVAIGVAWLHGRG